MIRANSPAFAPKEHVMSETKGSILFVANHEDTCEMMRTVLRQAGYTVLTATTVTDGVWFAKKGGFDLILLDWYYQDGKGLELCQMIRFFDNDTPIFFYTGTDMEDGAKEIKKAGAQGCFIEPLSIKELLETVSTHVHHTGNQDGKP
jgi:Response regulators consisting of a CheY-like receiver domain and a winged-helix DNA-binding domain